MACEQLQMLVDPVCVALSLILPKMNDGWT